MSYVNDFSKDVIEAIEAFDFYYTEHVNSEGHCFDIGDLKSDDCDPMCFVGYVAKMAVEYDCHGLNYDGKIFTIIIEDVKFKFTFVDGWANEWAK